ncbi:MAG: MoaD/ThiS family protein [Chloroflexi bacterium]|nr:MoaD/ThiS family protein [Chloroflexota bacterium]
MITVHVQFFGGIHLFTRQVSTEIARGLPEVRLPDGATIDDLLKLLGVPTTDGRPLVSINRFYQRDNAPLRPGDQVQIFRTVVGGAR